MMRMPTLSEAKDLKATQIEAVFVIEIILNWAVIVSIQTQCPNHNYNPTTLFDINWAHLSQDITRDLSFSTS